MIWPVCVDRLEIRKCPQVLVVIPFHREKQLRVATLFFIFFPFSPRWGTFSSSFGWIEKFTTTKLSTLIKSAAKPSTTKEHNIWGRWVIPLLNLEAGTEFQMSIITAGEGSEGHTQTCALTQTAHIHIHIHTHTHTHTHMRPRTVLWWKWICYWPLAHCSRAELKCPSSQNVTLWVCVDLCVHQVLITNIFKETDIDSSQIFDYLEREREKNKVQCSKF